ncbi:MAG: cation-translocating P-type ATPase C-terminal domain-containing protein, partial [Desulfobulbaceae bacterium]|nr:cation-translocating P-type ATPase C-terminal domain-containing protein [Desulfobulbaceae bacterium]
WPLLMRAYLFLGLFEAAAGMGAYFFVLTRGGWQWGEGLARTAPLYLQATTACLAAITVTQAVNVFLCKDPAERLTARRLFDNPIILWGITAEFALILAIVYLPVGNKIFGTAPLAPQVWLAMLPFAAAMLAAEELRKRVARRFGNTPRQRHPTGRKRGG